MQVEDMHFNHAFTLSESYVRRSRNAFWNEPLLSAIGVLYLSKCTFTLSKQCTYFNGGIVTSKNEKAGKHRKCFWMKSTIIKKETCRQLSASAQIATSSPSRRLSWLVWTDKVSSSLIKKRIQLSNNKQSPTLLMVPWPKCRRRNLYTRIWTLRIVCASAALQPPCR